MANKSGVSPRIQALFDAYNLFERLVAQKRDLSIPYEGKFKVRKIGDNRYRAHSLKEGLHVHIIGKVPNENGKGKRICFTEAPDELGSYPKGNGAEEVTAFLNEINEALQTDISQTAP